MLAIHPMDNSSKRDATQTHAVVHSFSSSGLITHVVCTSYVHVNHIFTSSFSLRPVVSVIN
jgi:hypothetical protein